ncbi:hypothetical protein MN608_07187 [Microdochium nivale]|nr:hypothetical protein MN608_07187 [Microdochium nivale]
MGSTGGSHGKDLKPKDPKKCQIMLTGRWAGNLLPCNQDVTSVVVVVVVVILAAANAAACCKTTQSVLKAGLVVCYLKLGYCRRVHFCRVEKRKSEQRRVEMRAGPSHYSISPRSTHSQRQQQLLTQG